MGVNGASVLQYELHNSPHLSSATPSKVTWIQWPLWGEKVSLYQKLKEHLVSKLYMVVNTNWIVQLTCQVSRSPRSCESNDPFEKKRCYYIKSLRNILSSSYGVERGKCATNWIVQLTCKCHALQGHVNPMTLMKWKGVMSLHEKL